MRRLVDMSPQVASGWLADLDPVEELQDTFPIDESRSYVVRYSEDEYHRLCGWAVIQMRNVDGALQRVAEYDACHQKGVHVHIYDADGLEIDEHSLHRPVRSYAELEAGLDYALERVVKDWLENERRADRGSDRGQ